VVHAIGNLVGTGTAGSLVTVVIGTVVTGAVALVGLVVARVPERAEPLAAARGDRRLAQTLAEDIRALIQEHVLELVAERRSVWLG